MLYLTVSTKALACKSSITRNEYIVRQLIHAFETTKPVQLFSIIINVILAKRRYVYMVKDKDLYEALM